MQPGYVWYQMAISAKLNVHVTEAQTEKPKEKKREEKRIERGEKKKLKEEENSAFTTGI